MNGVLSLICGLGLIAFGVVNGDSAYEVVDVGGGIGSPESAFNNGLTILSWSLRCGLCALK
jgi:hypothetical protein